MRAILDHCGAVPLEHMAGGSVILEEGQNTGRVYVLVEGRIEVLRGGTEVTAESESSSRSLFYRIFLTRTGICFA